MNLPVKSKPCIRINGVSYTFDYYNFFDNFYRVFQKSIVKRTKEGINIWNKVQAESSEEIVGDIFTSLLPGCVVHRSNYYPIENKNSAENDLIIEFKDILVIVEVKAASFSYTPAITDIISHKNSLSNLVEKAEKQCLRTRNYIDKQGCALFFDNNDLKSVSFEINRENYSSIYMFDVTIADFNELAAQMEKIDIADTKEGIITISLNDLWVYKEYFDSPYQFIHFLKQRTVATRTTAVRLYDELDHLGLYIAHNMYSKHAQELGDGYNEIIFDGYREELDIYFSNKYHNNVCRKPEQKIPQEYHDLFDLCKDKSVSGVTQFTNFLLDMSTDSRNEFCTAIHKLYKREQEIGRMISALAFGELSYCLFVRVEGVKNISFEEQIEYVLSTIAYNRNTYCYLIEIVLDNKEQITDFNFKLLTQNHIPKDREKDLFTKGGLLAKRKIDSYLIQTGMKKIGRNSKCPCGSGKKYKRCCGR